MNFTLSIIFSVVHVLVFFLYQSNYARLRKNDRYKSNDKTPIEKMPLARKITKLMFFCSFIFVLISFWIPSEFLGFWSGPFAIRVVGLFLTFSAYLFLKKSLSQLGKNYSPLFDTQRPYYIVKTGVYKYIRHPVYLCNMLIILGYVLAGSSIWVLLSSLWGWGYMIHSILKEEKFLQSEFAEYKEYQKTTWRIIPFLF